MAVYCLGLLTLRREKNLTIKQANMLARLSSNVLYLPPDKDFPHFQQLYHSEQVQRITQQCLL